MVKKTLVLLAMLGLVTSSIAQTAVNRADDAVSSDSWALQLPGVSHHFQPPAALNRTWNERNAALGLELRQVHSDYVLKYSAQYMRDSLNRDGVVGGVTWQKDLYHSKTWRVEGGAGAYLFYRALTFTGPRKLFPAVLPVFSVQHEPSQFGLNVIFVPPFKTGKGEMPAVLFAQLTKAF